MGMPQSYDEMTRNQKRQARAERPDASDYLTSELAAMPKGAHASITLPDGQRVHFIRTGNTGPRAEWLVCKGQAVSSKSLKGLAWVAGL